MPKTISGKAYVIDGDTIRIKQTQIRLAGIDAPEMDHPYGRKSKSAMIGLCRGRTITAHLTGDLSYNRVVARCIRDDGADLSAELVQIGLALDWKLFSGGRYRHLEPPGVRRKL